MAFQSTKPMVLIRLNWVLMLTVVALTTLSETAKVAAGVPGVVKSQAHGLLFSDQFRSRRRWPARHLMLGTTSSFLSSFTHSLVGKWLFSERFFDREQRIVTDLFKSHNVRDANAQNFFKSQQFIHWENEVKETFGDDSEHLIFSVMYKEFNARDNGGLEAIIAQAVKDRNTRDLGLHFEDLLLQELADGAKKMLVDDKEVFNFNDMWKYLRYPHYRDPDEVSVHQKMEQKLGDNSFLAQINLFEEVLRIKSSTPFAHLAHSFKIISGEREVADVFMELRPVEGFNNNAFLLQKLYEKATDPRINVNIADFMLTKLRNAGWTNNDIASYLFEIMKLNFSPDLREKLLNPMVNELAPLLPPSHELRYFYKDQPPKRKET